MKKMMKKLAVVFCLLMVVSAMAACGSSGKTDAITGTWKQTNEVDGNWIFTFSDGSKAKLVGETTGFTSDGTYVLDEANKKVTVTLDGWTDPKEFTYTLEGTSLKLVSTYASFDLVKQ